MKAIITQVTEVDINGIQNVTYNITDDKGEVLVDSQTIAEDVDNIEEAIKAKVVDFQAKYFSEKKLKEGDEITI